MLDRKAAEQTATKVVRTEYVCRLGFDSYLPDEKAWRRKLLEFGLEPEAFTTTSASGGGVVLQFWEPDRREALRILAKLDGIRAVTI